MRETARARQPRHRAAAQFVAPVLALLIVWFGFVEDIVRSDFLVFLRASSQVLNGVNPYTPSSDAFLWGGSAYVYPYLTAFLFAPLTAVPVATADVLFFLLCGVAIVSGCRLLGTRDPVVISTLLLSSTCIRSFQVGAINALLFLAGAVVWRFRDRAAVAAPGFTFFAGSKLFLMPLAVWLVFTRPRRAVIASLAGLAAWLGIGFVLQPISVAEFVRSMSVLAQHEGLQGLSLYRLVHLWVGDPLAGLVPMLVAGALLAAGIVHRFRRSGPPARGDAALFCCGILASLIATPVYWSHYTLLAALVVLIARPTRWAMAAFSLATWVAARPDHLASLLQFPTSLVLVTLSALLLASLAPGRSAPDFDVDQGLAVPTPSTEDLCVAR